MAFSQYSASLKLSLFVLGPGFQGEALTLSSPSATHAPQVSSLVFFFSLVFFLPTLSVLFFFLPCLKCLYLSFVSFSENLP